MKDKKLEKLVKKIQNSALTAAKESVEYADNLIKTHNEAQNEDGMEKAKEIKRFYKKELNTYVKLTKFFDLVISGKVPSKNIDMDELYTHYLTYAQRITIENLDLKLGILTGKTNVKRLIRRRGYTEFSKSKVLEIKAVSKKDWGIGK